MTLLDRDLLRVGLTTLLLITLAMTTGAALFGGLLVVAHHFRTAF